MTHAFYCCLITSLFVSYEFTEWRDAISLPLIAVACMIFGYQVGFRKDMTA